MEDRMIQPVQNNKEKQLTYRTLMSRYKRAMEQGFFCEAIMIDYAMIEDRLRSVIYHMGFLPNRQTATVWKKARPHLRGIVERYKGDKENDQLGTTTLSGKIKIVRCVLLWAATTEGGFENNKHLCTLKSQIEGIDIDDALHDLEAIEKWSECRNEIVHAMLNKNIVSLEDTLHPHAEEGMCLARALDTKERGIKKGNRIRRAVRLPIEK